MFPVWRQDDVDGAVVQREVLHEMQEFFFDLDWELVDKSLDSFTHDHLISD